MMCDQSVSPSLDKEGAGGWLRLLQPDIRTTPQSPPYPRRGSCILSLFSRQRRKDSLCLGGLQLDFRAELLANQPSDHLHKRFTRLIQYKVVSR